MKWLIGIVLFLALGWAGFYSGISSNWPGGGNAKLAQRELTAKTRFALDEGGFSNIVVTMDGQKAVLSGVVTSTEIRDAATKLVRASAGAGGLLIGGVTVVDASAMQVVAPVKNPYWQADIATNGQLILSGYVADETSQTAIMAAAANRFDGPILDQMKIAPGAFADALPEQIAVLGRMAQLNAGSASFLDGHFTLSGTASDKALAQLLSGQMAAIKGRFSGSAELSYPPPAPNKFGVRVEDGAIDDSAKCQALFADALSKNKILFASGSANVNASSYGFLDFLAKLAGQCGAFSLQISGHTDATGAPAYNIYLSGERAKAVVSHLTNEGVDASRMTARGFGSDRPVCTENTSDCRKRNRRIEITVGQRE